MDLRLLHYFVTVADARSVTLAAKRLHMTQPPLSVQIKKLEESMGAQLFVRSGRSIELTEAGALLRQRANEIFHLVEKTKNEVLEIASNQSGTLSIGMLPVASTLFLPSWIKLFQEDYPAVSFIVREGDTDVLAELLDNQEIELATMRLPIGGNYEYVPLADERIVLAVRKSSPLYTEGDGTIKFDRLLKLPLILPMRREWLDGFDVDALYLNKVFSCRSLVQGLSLVSEGLGCSIVPQYSKRLWHKDDLAYLDIVDPVCTSKIALVWRKGELSPFTRRFIEKTQLYNIPFGE